MKQLHVEANKSFEFGFVLSEAEIRRFIQLIKEQLKKINTETDISFDYKFKFENGVVAETDSIDDVIDQENEGSKKIISLEINAEDENENKISIDFSDLDSENIDSNNSIKYNIKSKDRDWVFVTSSLIEERINKIKRRIPIKKSNSSVYRLFSLFIPLAIMLAMLISVSHSLENDTGYLDRLKISYEEGELNSAIQVIFAIEEERIKRLERFDLVDAFFYPSIGLAIIFVIMILGYIYVDRLYPLYNFNWGDYLKVFNKIESTRKTFNSVVIIGLAISIIGGIIVKFIPV